MIHLLISSELTNIDGNIDWWWCFHCCIESESDSDSGGSIWIRGISTPFPTHQIQAVFLLHSHHVDSCRNCPFVRLVRRQDRRIPGGNLVCYEMGKSIRRVIVPCQFATSLLHSVDIHPCDVFSHSLLHHSYQAQDTGKPRWTVHQHSATAEQKKQKRASNVYCYRNSVCFLLVTLIYQLLNHIVSGQVHVFLV